MAAHRSPSQPTSDVISIVHVVDFRHLAECHKPAFTLIKQRIRVRADSVPFFTPSTIERAQLLTVRYQSLAIVRICDLFTDLKHRQLTVRWHSRSHCVDRMLDILLVYYYTSRIFPSPNAEHPQSPKCARRPLSKRSQAPRPRPWTQLPEHWFRSESCLAEWHRATRIAVRCNVS